MESFTEVIGYSFSGFLLDGALTALEIAVIAVTAGVVLGLGLAMTRLSTFAPLRAVSWFYVWFMRGTPELLQLVFLYDALPAIGIKFDSFTTAVLGFTLNEAAFCAEIIRGGILSVDRRQTIASAALGMGPFLTLRRITLPQAMRAILPALANQSISVIKGTAVASVIFVNELTFQPADRRSELQVLHRLHGRRHPVSGDDQRGGGPPAPPRTPLQSRDRAPPTGGAPAEAAPDEDGTPDWASLISNQGPASSDVDFVVCRDVHKAYGNREIPRGIDLTVRRGEVVVVMGPSGSGKSTLLRLINHLEHVDKGEIEVDGKLVGYERRDGQLKPVRDLAKARAEARVGMVFQSFNLFEHFTALENVAEAPVQVYGENEQTARARGVRLLEAVSLGRHIHHMPHRLSGGQQQRVAIARALAVSPKLMLFDEPTSALDSELVGEVLTALRHMAEAGMTMIVVTHEVRFAREVADRIVFMDEGLIVEQGTPEEVLDHPRQERTRRFLNLIERPSKQGA